MFGGLRLLIALSFFAAGLSALVMAEDVPASPGPPKTKVAPVEDTVSGPQDRRSRYRYLENSERSRHRAFTSSRRIAYTRSVLDPLFPAATRSTPASPNFLSIGTVNGLRRWAASTTSTPAAIAGQNQPVLYVREGVKWRWNRRSARRQQAYPADGTVALDWWYASERRQVHRLLASSPGGSEESTLNVSSRPRHWPHLCPPPSTALSAASLAWRTRQFRLLLHAPSPKG